MEVMHYVGLDVHKQTISFCVKRPDGRIVSEGAVSANRTALERWLGELPQPWAGALEATLFSGWIYDFLEPHAERLEVAHPQMLRAIVAAKRKNDSLDARMIADLLRADLIPACYMLPSPLRRLRRVLRYRNLIVREAVRFRNKAAGLLMEVGAEYNKGRLHGRAYFAELLRSLEWVPEEVSELLRITHNQVLLFQRLQQQLLNGLKSRPELRERVGLLMSIPGVGQVTALSWALEVGEPSRFRRVAEAVSYCGLCSAQRSSAGVEHRGPLSKQRNKALQHVLVEAAKLAPRWNLQLAEVHARELARGNRNRATLAVARKLVAYLLAVDKSGEPFEPRCRAA